MSRRAGTLLLLFGISINGCNCGKASDLIGIPADAGSGAASLYVTPTSLDFGSVVVHTLATLPITLTNFSTSPIDVSFTALQGPNAALFTLGTSGGLTLASGQQATLNVNFTPVQASTAPLTASFSIDAGGGSTAITLTGTAVATGLSIAPNPLAFGFLPVDKSLTKTLQLSNVGNQPITVSAITLDPATPAAAFAFASGSPQAPLSLAPGKSATLSVVFTPPSLAVFSGGITLTSNDSGSPKVVVPLTGTGGGPQIQCTPTNLAFGQAAVGIPLTMPLLCSNVGQDVPNDPASTLQIGALTVPDDPAFTAKFDKAPPAAGLPSGQSVQIDVTYTPQVAGQDSGHLHIASNDSQTPDEVVPLTGTGLSLPPCDSVIAPAGGLNFGVVATGQSLQLPFAVINEGVGNCLVQGLALSGATSSAFTLPNGPVASTILGFPGNAQGTPTSLTIPVQFSPQQAGTFAGAVDFTISNPGQPQISVPLSGQSGPSCLVVNPTSVDFGTVNLDSATNTWCSSLKRNVELINTCTTDIHVAGISIGAGTTTTPEFVISGQPASYPAAIPAGGAPIVFQVAFQPTAQGAATGAVAVTLEESPQGPYLVPLKGDAEPSGQEVDTFTVQTSPPQVDLLFVTDNDDDLEQDENIVAILPQFFAAMPANIDLHMAVTDTDFCSAPGADQGHFEPCANCQFAANPGDGTLTTVFTSQNPQAQAEVTSLIPHPAWNCASAGVDEHMFDGWYMALQPALLSGANAGFLRPNAYLAILEIDGDAEDDQSTDLGTVQAYYDFLVGVKGDPALVSYSYVNQGLSSLPGGANARVSQLVQMTGGVESDTTTSTWITDLIGLWTAATGLDQAIFPLNGQPVPTSVVVTVNGVQVPATSASGAAQWSYNAVSNAVDFSPGSVPSPGQTVTVTYTPACN
ncbi:MAG TPA: choice-of-anchor D domain-containing protein [Myxococcales bacterium]|nr:choice-of-anchor D domain-containing protein [Myxococcales bacterium]